VASSAIERRDDQVGRESCWYIARRELHGIDHGGSRFAPHKPHERGISS
jgi:hypothetical protein